MEKEIGKIKKNDTTDVVLRIDDFGGRKGLTIREFVTSDRYTGFTKSGVRILSPDFIKFREMINSVSLKDMEEEVGETSKKEQKKAGKNQKTLNESEDEIPDY